MITPHLSVVSLTKQNTADLITIKPVDRLAVSLSSTTHSVEKSCKDIINSFNQLHSVGDSPDIYRGTVHRIAGMRQNKVADDDLISGQ